MNLKEAFRYKNFLSSLLTECSERVYNKDFTQVTTRTHLRSLADSGAEDEQETSENPYPYTVAQLMQFTESLCYEEGAVTMAINQAKQNLPSDVDAEIAGNKFRQRYMKNLRAILEVKSGESKETGKSYRINAEGNQTAYYYNVAVSKGDNFDRAMIKDTLRKVSKESDTVSAEIDELMVTAQVDFIPLFDINGDFDDVVTEFLSR